MVKWLDHHHRVSVEPFQKAGLPEQLGLTIAECEQMAWAVTPDLVKFGGAAGINLSISVATGTRLFVWIYALPEIQVIQNRIYNWVVRNRHRLPGDIPFCEQFPAECNRGEMTYRSKSWDSRRSSKI